MADRVRALKVEEVGVGEGSDDDFGLPAVIDPTEDELACAGVVAGEAGKDGSDLLVRLYREADQWFFEDTNHAGGPGRKSLADLAASGSGISATTHRTLRQLIHFIDNGPAEGFASGAFREMTGTVFPSAIIWYDDNTKAKKFVEKNITYSGAFPTTIQWKMYDTDGTTVLATVTDTISYSGPFETNRTRAIA